MIDYVYILSASHSGSTLLTLLLDSHKEVASVGETSAVLESGKADTGLCSCGADLAHCAFWESVRDEMRRRGVDWNATDFRVAFRMPDSPLADRWLRAEYRDPLFEAVRDGLLSLHAGWRRRAPFLEQANRTLIESIAALRGARVFLDSSKAAHRLKFMRRISGLRTRVIHLVRDGRGVIASYIRKGMPLERAVEEWRRSLRSEEHVVRRFPSDAVTRIRYEDLCANVEGEVRRLWRFMGLDDSCGLSNWPSTEHHVLGNRMRLQAVSQIHVDERWRGDLSAADLDHFERCAGSINRHYGYAPSPKVIATLAAGREPV